MTNDPSRFLEDAYDKAMSLVGSGDKVITDLDLSQRRLLDVVLHNSEQAKGVLAVLRNRRADDQLVADESAGEDLDAAYAQTSGKNPTEP